MPCPSCGEPMPAGRGNRVRALLPVDGLADNRTKINQAAFRTPTMALHFMEFGTWLKETRGPEKAAQKLHRFVPFFREIEDTWQRIPRVRGSRSALRSEGTPIISACYAVDGGVTGLVKPDPEAREAESDRRRIEATLDQLPEGLEGARHSRGLSRCSR